MIPVTDTTQFRELKLIKTYISENISAPTEFIISKFVADIFSGGLVSLCTGGDY